MFNAVWRWAGDYRASERNFGVKAYLIQPELYQIIGDTRYAIQHKSCPLDELAVRFKHRVVLCIPSQTVMAAGRGWRETCWSSSKVALDLRGAAPIFKLKAT
jgi:hypothetical protein